MGRLIRVRLFSCSSATLSRSMHDMLCQEIKSRRFCSGMCNIIASFVAVGLGSLRCSRLGFVECLGFGTKLISKGIVMDFIGIK